MYWSRIAWLAFTAGFASFANSQESGWQENQVNATMCGWKALRSATLKDTVYMDGGFLSWVPGMADGTYGAPTQDNNVLGLIYTLNFSTPFNSSTNFSSILGTLSKAPNGGAANNFAPNYYDGALLANNDEFFLFGGLLVKSAAYSAPDSQEVLAYQVERYGAADNDGFHPGFVNDQLPDDLTRYITYGGAVSAPSENKAWYFGGYRSPTWGPIFHPSVNTSINPTNVSNSFITLDMASQTQEKWTNVTLPDGIESRANPSVVWVPVSEQGILVVLGGVSYPQYNNAAQESQNEAQSKKDSPNYMVDIDVYDVASGKWYQQPTTGGPGQLTQGCAVVAAAQDYSSYNIYYYGGFNGLDDKQDFNDDVWILSLPSFMWMKVSSGNAKHARAGHQCVVPYPDQMISIGGYKPENGGTISCLDGNSAMFEVFNLTSGEWMESYDPDNWNNYGVPEMIHLMIGGGYSGGATSTVPDPTGWATPELAHVFATPYATSKITTFYPYSSEGPGNGTRGEYKGNGGGGLASWVAPVLGVVLGLVFITAIGIAILLYRRRKLLKKRRNDPSVDENGNRITSWLNGQTNDGKAPTVTSEDTPTNHGDDMESRGVTPLRSPGHKPEMSMVHPYEMADTPLFEMHDTSHPAELDNTGLTPIDVINKHTHFGSVPHTPHTPHSVSPPVPSSFLASTVSRDHASSIHSQQQQQHQHSRLSSPSPPEHEQPQYERPDSPALGLDGPAPAPAPAPAPGSHDIAPHGHDTTDPISHGAAADSRPHVISGVSSLTEREASHLRQISNSTVNSAAGNNHSSNGGGVVDDGSNSRPHTPTPFFSPLGSPSFEAAMPVSPPLDHETLDFGPGPHVQGLGLGLGLGHGRTLTSGSAGSGASGTGGGAPSSPLRRSVFRESADDLGEHHRD